MGDLETVRELCSPTATVAEATRLAAASTVQLIGRHSGHCLEEIGPISGHSPQIGRWPVAVLVEE